MSHPGQRPSRTVSCENMQRLVSVSVRAGYWVAGQVCRGQSSVLERRPHWPQGLYRPRKAYNTLAVCQTWKRETGKEQSRKQNSVKLPGVHYLWLHPQTPAAGLPEALHTDSPF